jgi:RHS repeat-associated protein
MITRSQTITGDHSLDERLWAEQDANHNVTSIVNNSGVVQERFVYDPYGKVTVLDSNWVGTSDTKSWNVLFQGLRWDSTAEDYEVRNRRYDPTLGRFTTQDPAGYVDGANLYQFVTSNPLQNCDPTGLYVPSHLPTTAPKATISEWDKWNNEVNRLGAQINTLGIQRAQLTDFIDKVLPNVCVSPVDYWLELEDALRERALLEAKTKVLQQQWTNAILKRQAAQRDKRP